MTIDPSLRFSTPQASPTPLQAASGSPPPRDLEITRQLDQLRNLSTATYSLIYRDPEGTERTVTARVPSPFRMASESPFGVRGDERSGAATPGLYSGRRDPETMIKRLAAALGPGGLQKLGPAAQRVVWGQGSPAQVQTVTRALIEAGQLQKLLGQLGWTGGPLSERQLGAAVRRLQMNFGIGVDCASYVRMAVDLAVPGRPHGLPGLRVGGLARNRAFEQIARPEQVRPGDILDLGKVPGGDVGHFAIVRSQRPATASEVRALGVGGTGFGAGGRLQLLEVDSSWGGDRQDVGKSGVQRRLLAHDPVTRLWAEVSARPDGRPQVKITPAGPYDHPLDGFYRRR